jgi:hypothetical protein
LRAQVDREAAKRIYAFELASGRDKTDAPDWPRLEAMSGNDLVDLAAWTLGNRPKLVAALAAKGFESADPKARFNALWMVACRWEKGGVSREKLERMRTVVLEDLESGKFPDAEDRWKATKALRETATALKMMCEADGDEEGAAAWAAEAKARSDEMDGRWDELEASWATQKEERDAEVRRADAAAAAWKPSCPAERHFRRGWEWSGMGRYLDAEAELRRAAEMADADGNIPFAQEARAVLAASLLESGRWEAARELCEAELAAGSPFEDDLWETWASLEALQNGREAGAEATLAGWAASRGADNDTREAWDGRLTAAAGGMSRVQLEIWAQLCADILEQGPWTDENREQLVRATVTRWALGELLGVSPPPPSAENRLSPVDSPSPPSPSALLSPAPSSPPSLRASWTGWAWKTDPAIPEIEREFCSLLIGDKPTEMWQVWRDRWGEDAARALKIDGVGALGVSFAEEGEEDVRYRNDATPLRTAVEEFKTGDGFCAYRLVAALRELAERIPEKAEPSDLTELAAWTDWAVRAAQGWHGPAEASAAWMELQLARRMGDAERTARAVRKALAAAPGAPNDWESFLCGRDALSALAAAGDWEALGDAAADLMPVGGGSTGLAMHAAELASAAALGKMRDTLLRWVAVRLGEAPLMAANAWRTLGDSSRLFALARLAELEESGAWNCDAGEAEVRAIQDEHPTPRGAALLVRRAAARGDSAGAWQEWLGAVGAWTASVEGMWFDPESTDREAVPAERVRRLAEITASCGPMPDDLREKIAQAWQILLLSSPSSAHPSLLSSALLSGTPRDLLSPPPPDDPLLTPLPLPGDTPIEVL